MQSKTHSRNETRAPHARRTSLLSVRAGVKICLHVQTTYITLRFFLFAFGGVWSWNPSFSGSRDLFAGGDTGRSLRDILFKGDEGAGSGDKVVLIDKGCRGRSARRRRILKKGNEDGFTEFRDPEVASEAKIELIDIGCRGRSARSGPISEIWDRVIDLSGLVVQAYSCQFLCLVESPLCCLVTSDPFGCSRPGLRVVVGYETSKGGPSRIVWVVGGLNGTK
jgi:hypothetical protein